MQLNVSLIEVAICRASYGNHAEVVNFLLLSAGADLSARTADGWTPLHSAARWNAFACVEILLAQVQLVRAGDVNVKCMRLMDNNFSERLHYLYYMHHMCTFTCMKC